MKQILLSTGCALLALGTHAQMNRSTGPIINSFSEDTHVLHSSSLRGAGGASGTIANQVDTIWYEDFGAGIPSGWVLSGTNSAACPWVYSTDGSWGFFNGNGGTAGDPPMASTTSSNGFLINDPDSANNAIYGQPSGANYQYLDSYITTAPISTVGYPNVRLEFEQLFRYNNDPELQVGISTDGINFTFYDAKGDVSANDQSSNPSLYSLDISALAGNSSTVYLRFGWSARVYYWMIDDIRLVTPPDYDLSITQEYYGGYSDSTRSRYYTGIPVKHANLDTLVFGASVENSGGAINNNIQLSASVSKDGSPVFQTGSNSINLNPGEIDSLDVTNEFYPTQGLGTYTVTIQTSSDSADYDSTNNTIESTFEVTQDEYRRDNNNSNQGNWFNANTWELLVGFEIFEQDTAVAISCLFPDLNNGYGLKIGDPLSYYLYREDDLGTPVGSREFYSVQSADQDSWVTLQLSQPAVLTPGLYYAGFKIFNPEIAIGTHTGLNENVPPFAVLNRIDESGPDGWGYRTDMLPFVRLITIDSEICKNVSIDITGVVDDASFQGSITTNVSGGTNPYSYSWTGPNGFASSSPNLTGLDIKGTYTLTVSDSNGCVSDPMNFEVAGAVYTTNNAKNNIDLRIYPNPAKESLFLKFNGLNFTEAAIVEFTDISGKVTQSKTLNISNQGASNISLQNLNNGIYFLTIKTSSGETFIEKLVINK